MVLLRSVLNALAVSVLATSTQAHSFRPHHEHHHADLIPRATNVDETPAMSYNQLYTLTKKFFDTFLYPANVAEAKKINSTLLADNVIGRVDVTRNFLGSELNTEYLFGLFTGQTLNAGVASLLGVPESYEIVHFAAYQYVVSVAAIVTFNINSQSIPIEIDAWIAFNSASKIHQYDATFRWFDQVLDMLVTNVQAAIGATTTDQAYAYITDTLSTSICDTAATYCNGTNTQYNSTADCKSFLTDDIRFGKSYEMGRNTLLCRMIHQYMVPFRPAVHCPHIGPGGGGMCVDDQTYAQRVSEAVFTNAPFVPGGKASKDASVAAMR